MHSNPEYMTEQGSIALQTHIVVDERMNYRERAKLMLEDAIRSNALRTDNKFRTDNKCYTTLKGIESLIGAGAEIIRLNESRGEGSALVHEVLYQGQMFITTSGKPFAYTIDFSLK